MKYTHYILLFSLLVATNHGNCQEHRFPEKAYWFNCEYQLTLEALATKFVLVAITDLNCIESNYYLNELKPTLQQLPHIQLIQVLLADTAAPIARSQLVRYAQQNNFQHPIAIFPDLKGFTGTTIHSLPYFILYERGATPVYKGEGFEGFFGLNKFIENLKQQPERLEMALRHQYSSLHSTLAFADPIIEYPTYLESGTEGGLIINDATHNRIIELDSKGEFKRMLGTTLSGHLDETIYSSHLKRPHGFCRDGNDVYIADTYNNRIRKFDLNTELVSTLTGNGYFTNKKLEKIDGIHEPLGLPIDVAMLGGKLYAASYSSGQVYSVDMQNGECELLCDIPNEKNGLVQSKPVNLSAGEDDLYIITNDGKVYITDRKGKIRLLDSKLKWPMVAICEWEEGIIGLTKDGNLIYFTDNKWKVLGESKKENTTNLLKCNAPCDMINVNGKLYITDTENHRIKELESIHDGMLKNFWLKPSPELIGFEAATSFGEVTELDTLFLNGYDVRANILLDLEGYEISKLGQNEIVSHDATGKVKLKSDVFHKPELSFEVEADYSEPDIYFELYITLTKPDQPGFYLIKRAYVDVPVVKSKKAEAVQDQIFKPNILPY